ncbi:MAG: hypothetical protein ABI718_12405 [Acidobacteriota bacterium]
MRLLFSIATSLLFAASVYAVTPQFWTVNAPDEMLAGEVRGFAITSRGELRPGPQTTKLASVADPFVLSQANGPSGVLFLGTGNAGKVYRLEGKQLRLLYTAPEPEIYAMAYSHGMLYVGTSPNGKIYRVEPGTGKATTFYDPDQAYIWGIVPLEDGSLAVATGVDGKLFKVSPSGQGSVWFDSPETHIRSIAVKSDGTLLLGGAGKGRIYALPPSGTPRALYDASFNEISTIYYDSRTGSAYAAGVTNVLPTVAPAKKETSAKDKSATNASAAKEDKSDEATTQSASVDVSFSFDDNAAPSAAPSGSAELYRIDGDGYVESIRKFDHEIIYAITGGNDGALYIGTGPQGRVYVLKDGEVSLVSSLPEKQVVSIERNGGALTATTTNSGAVYQLGASSPEAAEFRSPTKDTGRFSRFGQFRVDGDALSAATISFRSGNTSPPDNTWSAWSASQPSSTGTVNAPAARYLQWKLSATKPSQSFRVDSVSVAYMNRNVAPSIDSVVVNEPAVVFLSGNYPAAPQVVEASNPDENGIFTTLGEATDRTIGGKKYFRHGYRTVSWKASDVNGDRLIYTLQFRQSGSSSWLTLHDRLEDLQFNFDTSQLPDGDYELRLVASDEPSNSESPLTDAKSGIIFTVDNTPPLISSSSSGGKLVIKASDERSPVIKAEYSVDARKWLPLTPDDGINDSRVETFSIDQSAVQGRFVIVRVIDSFYNVATSSVTSRQ